MSKHAIVTGACSGLGNATAKALLANDYIVHIFDIDAEKGAQVASELHSTNCHFYQVDVTSAESVESAFAQLGEAPISLLVNCAGIAPAKRTLNKTGDAMPLDDFARVININLVGSFNVARMASSHMAKHTTANDDGARGVIINTASVAAYEGQIGQTAYAASKGGLVGLTLPMARDLAPLGIRVNTIAPGIMGTPMLLAMPEHVQEALASNVQYPKRLGNPAEFAELVLHIASNNYINAETIRLDGGLRMPPK